MNALSQDPSRSAIPRLWLVVLFTAAAGGMGWGIRGQYGHETGAMIAGLLVGLVVACLFATARLGSLWAARVAAVTAIGISFGGSMTYGQTVGLTHDAELIGNWAALGWGMLGLFIKGGVWIGLAGGFLGIALGGQRYRPLELALLMFVMIGLLFCGVLLINEPFDPADRLLPSIYFSDHWHWEPDKVDLEPRRERWGGLLFALVGLVLFLDFKRDKPARNVALVGFVSGGIGFAAGQAIQAYHAWNREAVDAWLGPLAPLVNWWNLMEITFGAVLGAGLGLGAWLYRRSAVRWGEPTSTGSSFAAYAAEISPPWELVLLVTHTAAVAVWNFYSYRAFDLFAGLAVTMGVVPLVIAMGGRHAAYFLALPIVALPIAGKTLRQLCYETDYLPRREGWLLLVALPMLLTVAAAAIFAWRGRHGQSESSFARWALLLTTWLYFWLNFAFFELPWPWQEATYRTPSAIVFLICSLLLTTLCLLPMRTERVPVHP